MNNCYGCKWLDQLHSGRKGDGYCCMVQKSRSYKPGDKARYAEYEACELYEIGDFETRYEEKETADAR